MTPNGTLDAELGEALAGASPSPMASRFGVEQEFTILDGSGPVDFSVIARSGALPGRRLDRGDPNAHRLSWGAVLTADGREAEIATPPATLEPGFTTVVADWLRRGRAEVDRVLEPGGRVEGYSTHLNIEVDDAHVVAVGRRFVRRHAGALMLLMDRSSSPGLLVRPRRGRLELGGEYAAGDQLTAAAVFAAAAARDCSTSRTSWTSRPDVVPDVVRSRERYGWFVDRRAFGDDLSVRGRSAALRGSSGQDLLTWSWHRVRAHAEEFASPAEMAMVDSIIAGDLPLPCELPFEWGQRQSGDEPWLDAVGAPADITIPHSHDHFVLTAVIATWDHTVFELASAETVRIVAVRAAATDRLLELFSSGALDGWCARAIATDPLRLSVLSVPADIGGGAVFSSINPTSTMHADERNPASGRPGGVNTPPGARHQKNHDEHAPRPRKIKPWMLVGAAAVIIAAGVGIAAAASGDDSPKAAEPAPTTPVTVAPPPTTIASTTTEAATTTTVAPPLAGVSSLAGGIDARLAGAADFAPLADGASVSSGDFVRTDASGYLQLTFDGGSLVRLDSASTLNLVEPAHFAIDEGRAWIRVGDGGPVQTIDTAVGSLAVSPGGTVLIQCHADACTIAVLSGTVQLSAADGTTSMLTAPTVVIVDGSGALPTPLPFDAAFGDPWVKDNAARDVDLGFASSGALYSAYGPALASLNGDFPAIRTVTDTHCLDAQCDLGPFPVGDVAGRLYNFSIDCSAGFPCVGSVQTEYTTGAEVQQQQVALTFDGTTYTWQLSYPIYQCQVDTDGDGVYESQLGTQQTTLMWELTPTAAEIRNGEWTVTAFTGVANGLNQVTTAAPECAAYGSTANSSVLVGSR